MLNRLEEVMIRLIDKNILRGGCRFRKECPNYCQNNETCITDSGKDYYTGGSPAGCYRRMLEKTARFR